MTREEKARAIITAGNYIIHDCNLSETEPADDTRIYYLSDEEINDIYSMSMQPTDPNAWRAEDTETVTLAPANLPIEDCTFEDEDAHNNETKEEEKTMETKNELREYCENIQKELKEIYDGTTTERNDDDEPMTMYDYFADALDYEYTIASDGQYLGVRIYVAIGGPNVWVDTRRGEIGGAWGTDRAEAWLPREIADEIDEMFEDLYNTTRQ